jgi:hypothetical protein
MSNPHGKDSIMHIGMHIRMLDPTVAPDLVEATAAKRLGGLDGKVLGLLANGKVNGDALLELVREELAARYQLQAVVLRAKPNASRVAPAEIMEDLAARCDAVVTAIGD